MWYIKFQVSGLTNLMITYYKVKECLLKNLKAMPKSHSKGLFLYVSPLLFHGNLQLEVLRMLKVLRKTGN